MTVEAKPMWWYICTPLAEGERLPDGTTLQTCDLCGRDVIVSDLAAPVLAMLGHEIVCAYCGWQAIGAWNGERLDREAHRDE